MDVFLKYLIVFAVGGILCAIAQIIIDKTKLSPARILVIYVCSGVVLSGLGIYSHIVSFANAGATVPLLGFGHLVAQGVKEAVDTTGLLGVLTGGLRATAGGISAALIFGFLASLVFSSKPKK